MSEQLIKVNCIMPDGSIEPQYITKRQYDENLDRIFVFRHDLERVCRSLGLLDEFQEWERKKQPFRKMDSVTN